RAPNPSNLDPSLSARPFCRHGRCRRRGTRRRRSRRSPRRRARDPSIPFPPRRARGGRSPLPRHRRRRRRRLRPHPRLPRRRDAHRPDRGAAREAGILIDPSTAHRLVAVAIFVGAKFGGPIYRLPTRWTVVFETSSDAAIRAREMAGLERRFLIAVDYRLFVRADQFDWFCRVLERGPRPSGRCGGGGAGRKRTAAEAVEGEAEDGRRRVRASLPPPSVVAN
ncbi:Os05g0327000, partial [Oryza sativa Japonica Group]